MKIITSFQKISFLAILSFSLFLHAQNDYSDQKIIHQNIDLFKTITKDDDLKSIYKKVGQPDKDLGSGVFILIYKIESGGEVMIWYSSPGTAHITFVQNNKEIVILE